jgi:hypothetical protein
MEVRFAIGALVALDDVPRGAVSRLCREYGISRDTFYRYRAQLEAEGLHGLLPKSRRPHRSPNATPPAMVELLVAKHHELVVGGGYRVALGREWAGARLHVLRDDQHLVVFHDQDLVKRLTLDPDHKDVPSGLPQHRRPAKPLPST